MLSRSHRVTEALVRYWANQTLELRDDIDNEGLTESADALKEALSALNCDRRVVFIGGRGCGKSSLLAAVAELPVIAKVPLTQPYVCWRYRCDDGDTTCSRFIPEPSLEGLELVDTTDCGEAQAAATLSKLLPGADVVVAVMDARAPEASPAWNLLAELPEGSVGTLMLAMTFTDTLGADEVVQLGEHLRELCRARLRTVPAAYHVSPSSATAVESFTKRVQESLNAGGGVRRVIKNAQKIALELVQKEGSVLKGREAIMRQNNGFLATIEQEIENFQSRQTLSAEACREHYTDAVRRVRPRLLRRLTWSLGFFFSPVTMLRLEGYGVGVERTYCSLVQQDVCRLQQENDQNFILSCASHWKSVRPRMKQAMDCEIGDFPEQQLSEDLAQMRTRLEHDLNKPFLTERVRAALCSSFRAPLGWMRAVLMILCLMMTFAGLCGVLGQEDAALMLLSLTGILWLVACAMHLLTVHHLRRKVDETAERLYETMYSNLKDVVNSLIISRVTAYRRLYTMPRRKVEEHQANLQPLQERHMEILTRMRSCVPPL